MGGRDKTKEALLSEIERFKAALEKSRERERDLEDTRNAMLFMLEDLNETAANLVRAKKEWETTFDSIPDPLFIHDREFKLLRVNRAYAQAAGMDFRDMIGKPYYEVFPKMDGPFRICRQATELVMTADDEFAASEDMIFKMRVYPIRETGGRYLYSVHVLEDVTEEKKAERALKNEAAVSKALLEASGITIAGLDWEEIVEKILALLHGLADSRGVAVVIINEDGTLRPVKAVGVREDVLSFFYSIQERADEIPAFMEIIRTNKPISAKKSSLGRLVPEHCSKALGLQDLIITPIIARDKVVGFLTGNFERLPSDPRVPKIFQGIAGQLGVAYENARLYEDSVKKGLALAKKVETLKVLSEIDQIILSILDREEMLSRAVHQIRRIVPADVGGVFLLDPEAHALRYSYGWGLGLQKDDAVPLDGCSGSACLESGKPQVRANIQEVGSLTYMDRKLADSGVCSDMYVPIISKGVGAGLLCLGSFRVAGFSLEDVHTAENLANQISIALENTKLFSDLEEMLINVVLALSSAIDAKSPWTKGHSERVTGYAVQVARMMGFGEEEIDRLKLAGLLHDIGKIGTYDVILDKPDKLTAEEFEMVKRHPDRGCEILSPIKQFKDILPAIRHHHERWDGKGYPAGLKGEATPLMARILAVADSFDSMTADRPYRPSPGVEYAVSEFRRCKGTQFDPKVVDIFLEILNEKI